MIKILCMGVTIYNPPLTRSFLETANEEYNKKTTDEVNKLRHKLVAEADAKGLTGINKGDYLR